MGLQRVGGCTGKSVLGKCGGIRMKNFSVKPVVLSELRFCQACKKPMGRGFSAYQIKFSDQMRHWMCPDCCKKMEESCADK